MVYWLRILHVFPVSELWLLVWLVGLHRVESNCVRTARFRPHSRGHNFNLGVQGLGFRGLECRV